ncbi:ArsR/SmtB family transcription factor [Streptomyces clavifer]|uniref:ArsR/SmtB family transcription factor n=1 Tax=Streptomyces clavifer TaxID=68188 RepID=UPI0036684F59
MPLPSRPPGSGVPEPTRVQALAALLGATRAHVLLRIAELQSATTNDLVQELAVSAATVSHHTGVLRHSALITTERSGVSVQHALTPLGESLLGAHAVPSRRPSPGGSV